MARMGAATAVGARSLICVSPSRAARPTADTRVHPTVEATADIVEPRATAADRVLPVMAAVDIPMGGVVVITAAAVVADTPEVGATEVVEVTVAVAAIDRVRDIRMSRSSSKLLYSK